MEYPSATHTKPGSIVCMREIHGDHSSTNTIPAAGPAEWPIAPQSLKENSWAEWALDAYDAALCMIPIALVAKIGLCIHASHLDHKHVGFWVGEASSLTLNLIRFNQQLTTAFTIVFVLIFTTFLRRFALWRAQTSEYVVRLEQYQASISLPSTLRLIFSLRSFNLVSLALISTWSFYYVGSQAGKEEYMLQTTGPERRFNVSYLNWSAPTMFDNETFSATSNYFSGPLQSANVDFVTNSQIALTQSGSPGSDYAGSAIAPWVETPDDALIDYVRNLADVVDYHAWKDTLSATKQIYASYVGILAWSEGSFENNINEVPLGSTVTGYSVAGNYAFNTSYFKSTCAPPVLVPPSSFPGKNSTGSKYAITMTENENIDEIIRQNSSRTFGVWLGANDTVLRSSCNITKLDMEARVHCDGKRCSCSQVRITPGRDAVLYRTPFDSNRFANNFIGAFSTAAEYQVKTAMDFDSIESSIQSSHPAATVQTILAAQNIDPIEWASSTAESLTQLINTYYIVSQTNNPTVENIMTDMVAIINGKSSEGYYSRTNMKGAIYVPAYRVNVGWIAADIMANTILFAAAIGAFWLRKNTLAPDVFGYVSSLTRDNPNFHLPEGGTTLSGLERARLLRNLKVRIVDVGTSNGAGRVVLTHADASDIQYSDLQREKRYV